MTNFLSLGSALMLVVASALVRADTIEVSDYLEYERVDDAQISPDGSQVIFTRRWVDQKTDRWSSAL